MRPDSSNLRAQAKGAEILYWLTSEAVRKKDFGSVLAALIERLRDDGVQIDRLRGSHPTLHPEIYATVFEWREEAGFSQVSIGYGMDSTPDYVGSPFQAIIEGAGAVRQKIEGVSGFSHAVFDELKDDGFTDYVALPLIFTTRGVAPISWSTKRTGGFSPEDLTIIDMVMPGLSLLSEIESARVTTISLLGTYLGRQTGEKVLTGRIRRGEAESMRAVLWFCDMRGFTSLAEVLPPEYLIHVLNDYFEALSSVVQEHGGEVLKFVGDAMLAVFRVPDASHEAATCAQALDAANAALESLASLNTRRALENKPPLRFSLALHLGEVLYGNIGGADRLDFTVIGRAVNLAARLEKLAGDKELNVIASADFAAHFPKDSMVSLGHFPLKGFADQQEAFAPSEAYAAPA